MVVVLSSLITTLFSKPAPLLEQGAARPFLTVGVLDLVNPRKGLAILFDGVLTRVIYEEFGKELAVRLATFTTGADEERLEGLCCRIGPDIAVPQTFVVCFIKETGVALLSGRKTYGGTEATLVCQVLECLIVGVVGNAEAPRNAKFSDGCFNSCKICRIS